MAWYKFIAILSHLSLRFIEVVYKLTEKIFKFLNAILSGFWLGVMSEKSLDFSDELHYNHHKRSTDDEYNLSGLFDWEKDRIEKYFSNAKDILLIAAGGGREIMALSKMGFEVDSYECNTVLIEYGNELLQKSGIENKIKYLPRNRVPDETKKYDGIIIGWGAYSHIRGIKKRLSFLSGLYPFLHEETPLMISFLWTGRRTRYDKIIKNVSNFFRIFSKKDKTELGDRLREEFIHFFSEEEIKNELIQSKFRIIDYYSTDYGCVIAGI
jgi:hypothetical protein